MIRSLGDFNKEQSSTSDYMNIRWTKKNNSKKKRTKINLNPGSPLNILQPVGAIIAKKIRKKTFKIDEKKETKTAKNMDNKRF